MKSTVSLFLAFAFFLALTGCKSKIFQDLELTSSGSDDGDAGQEEIIEDPLPDTATVDSEASTALKSESFVDDPDVKAKRAELERLAAVERSVTVKIEGLRSTISELENSESEKRAALNKLSNELANKKNALENEIANLEQSKKRLTDEKDKLLTENKILLKHYDETKITLAEMKKRKDAEESKLKELTETLQRRASKHEADQKRIQALRAEVVKMEVKKRELDKLTANFDELKRKLNENIRKMTLSAQALENQNVPKSIEKRPPTEKKPSPPPVVPKEKPQVKPADTTAPSPTNPVVTPCEVAMDSYLIESAPDDNKGTAPGLVAGYSKAYKNLRGVIKFKLPPKLKPSAVKKATLKCYCYTTFKSKMPQTVGIRAIKDDWDEKDVTWEDVKFDPQPIDERRVDRKDVWVTWDVTPLVKRWLEDESANHGLLLIGAPSESGESTYYGFRSKEGESNPPTLEILSE